jgi:hypothetical protein
MQKVKVIAAYREKDGRVVQPSLDPCVLPDDVAILLAKKGCVVILGAASSDQGHHLLHSEKPVEAKPSSKKTVLVAPVRRRGRPRKT